VGSSTIICCAVDMEESSVLPHCILCIAPVLIINQVGQGAGGGGGCRAERGCRSVAGCCVSRPCSATKHRAQCVQC
jgi:hypothetical protein